MIKNDKYKFGRIIGEIMKVRYDKINGTNAF